MMRGGSSTVPQSKAEGKKTKGNSHPKRRRYDSVDGNDEADIGGSESKKHKKNNGDGLEDDEKTMHDYHRDDYTPNDGFGEKVATPSKPTLSEEGEGEGGDESPISGLNLLAEEADKGTRKDKVYEDPPENKCLVLTVWPQPESYVLPPEDVTDEQAGKASPTNSEDYKTPPEDAPMTECRRPEVGKCKNRR
ncbi:hypothetical protein Bca52824_011225 [Brassica carinata]|uniref:Uncharacterized protein n=1 Tax=Brassica carinata TaxID=52824 RepID=A0A8X8BC09_BRACI|nr:hypothetical protein Bca52824_011225 [Brassica carinata]